MCFHQSPLMSTPMSLQLRRLSKVKTGTGHPGNVNHGNEQSQLSKIIRKRVLPVSRNSPFLKVWAGGSVYHERCFKKGKRWHGDIGRITTGMFRLYNLETHVCRGGEIRALGTLSFTENVKTIPVYFLPVNDKVFRFWAQLSPIAFWDDEKCFFL